MDIDWDELEKKAKKAAEEASIEADEELASDISSITRLTDENIQELCPEPADKEKLTKLLRIVKSATSHNTKVAELQQSIGDYIGIIIKLIAKLS